MFANYLKVAVRTISRHKGYSFINIAGLAVGMACCILILLWVQDELSYDAFHDHADRLYRVVKFYDRGEGVERAAVTPDPLGPALENGFPQIAAVSRFSDEGPKLIRAADKKFQDDVLALADPDFFVMFSYPLTAGNPTEVFADPFSVVITEKMSRKYFGRADPIGKVLNIDRRDYTVSGVVRDLPRNSHLQFDCIAPFDSRPEHLKTALGQWKVSAYYTYVLLRERAAAEDVNRKIAGLIDDHRPEHDYAINLSLQPIRRIHLHHEFKDYLSGHGDIRHVYMFSALAFLILLIACANYMNLTTARAEARAKEVGMRKVAGASRIELIRQYLGESLVLAVIGLVGALVLVELFLPAFSSWAGKPLHTDYVGNPRAVLGLLGIVLVTAMLAGSYPAFVLSSYTPVRVMRRGQMGSTQRLNLRTALVIGQFTLAVVLIISAVTIDKQLAFMKNKQLGFAKDHLIYFQLRGDFARDYASVKDDLLRHPSIRAAAGGIPPVEMFDPAISIQWEGKPASDNDEEMVWYSLTVDGDYPETFKMELVSGAGFSPGRSAAAGSELLINEAAAHMMAVDDPVGTRLSFASYKSSIDPIPYEGTVIGVVRDFHYGPLYTAIEPVIIHVDRDYLAYMTVRVQPGRIPEALGVLQKIWAERAPEYPFEYRFVDETIGGFYESESRLSSIFSSATLLAILISCLGLLGLVSHVAARRAREIGIRRTFGSTIPGIVALVVRKFLILVAIANVIGWPLAYLAVDRWLENFAYRTEIGPGPFVTAAILALGVALAAVSFQALRAALANPVNALRHE